MKDPQFRAGSRIECPRVAGDTERIVLLAIRAQHHQILEHGGHSGIGCIQCQHALFAESWIQFAALRI